MNSSQAIATKAKKTKTSKPNSKSKNMSEKGSSAIMDIDVATKDSKCSKMCNKMEMKAKTVTVYVKADIGWGNKMFIRGEGACLSWSKGMQMICVSNDMWMWKCDTNDTSIAFKMLINDEIWSSGDNYSMDSGTEITITPTF